MSLSYCVFRMPLGDMIALADRDSLYALRFINGGRNREETLLFWQKTYKNKSSVEDSHHPVLKQVQSQLEEYFSGCRTAFDIPMHFIGTSFQQKVWHSLSSIPFAQTWSYQKQAHFLNKPKAVRAIGQANSRNPIAIILPCHRVIASNGSLGGYYYSLEKKEQLLRHEQSFLSS